MHLGAFMTAVVAYDYLPFAPAANGLCALAVWMVEGFVAERIYRDRTEI
jgi:hypothetical protein